MLSCVIKCYLELSNAILGYLIICYAILWHLMLSCVIRCYLKLSNAILGYFLDDCYMMLMVMMLMKTMTPSMMIIMMYPSVTLIR